MAGLAICALAWVASAPLCFAADLPSAKNVLVLYSFSDSSLFDALDNLKSAIRSRVHSPVNFYVHHMEAQGFEDPSYEESLSETLYSVRDPAIFRPLDVAKEIFSHHLIDFKDLLSQLHTTAAGG